MIDYSIILRGVGYWLQEWQLNLQDALRNYLLRNNLTQEQFAERLGVKQSYVSQILNGQFDHRISKFIELYLAIEKVPFVTERDMYVVISQWQRHADRHSSFEMEMVDEATGPSTLLTPNSTAQQSAAVAGFVEFEIGIQSRTRLHATR